MKKLVSFLLVFTLLFSLQLPSWGASKVVHVKLLSADMLSNNHVGNDWSYDAQIAGQSVAVGDSIEVKSASKVKLYAETIEDDKYPDVGSKSLTIKPGSSIGKQFVLKVTVTENRGRYSGNTAVWAFTFEVTE